MRGHKSQAIGRTPDQLCGAAADPGVAQPVEAVAAQPPAPCPLPWNGIDGCLVAQGGVECGVEAGDLGKIGVEAVYRPDRGHRRRIVQGSEIAESIEALVDRIVETNGFTKFASPVHDAMSGGRDLRSGGEEAAQGPVKLVARHRGQIVASLQVLGGVEEPELEAARARVDYEDVHRVSLAGPGQACHPSRPARDGSLQLTGRGDHRPFLESLFGS